MILVVDYGSSNLLSVVKAFDYLEVPNKICSSPEEIVEAKGVVLPGVGSFGDCLRNLRERGLDRAIIDYIFSGRPYLGICLGMQILFESSVEEASVEGLGVIKGKVHKLPPGVKIPHIGWNELRIVKKHPFLEEIPQHSYFYFDHSYYCQPLDSSEIIGVTDYGIDFPSAVGRKNLLGVQFHPEKSSSAGLKILKNFALWAEES